MIDLWRSEEMQRIRLMIPAEAAHATITTLGELGIVQFVDLNPHKSGFQKTFSTEIKRCDEMARKLRFFREQIEKAGHVKGNVSDINELSLDELETRLDELEKELVQVNVNSDQISRSAAELIEMQLVLEKAGGFFEEAQQLTGATGFTESTAQTSDVPLLESAFPIETKVGKLGFVAGLIETAKLFQFERTLFKATRGNIFLKHSEVGSVVDPSTGEKVEKQVFVVFFSGERIKIKIDKISEVFGANKYPFPEEPGRQHVMHREVSMRLRELETTIEAGERMREGVLRTIALKLNTWIARVMREKATFHIMNKLSIDNSRKVLVGEGWIPKKTEESVKDAIRRASTSSSAQTSTIVENMRTQGAPPTYFETTKFTQGFQNIVDAYGVAKYREVNPTIFTIITFPFLFAVMFGDFGHGILMLLFALLLIIREQAMMKSKLNDMVEMLFSGRYVILLMSLFSIFTGLIYNEAFSVPMTIFGGTTWKCEESPDDFRGCPEDAIFKSDKTYPFGLDPIWHGRTNELTFTNSVKMKMSIILGIMHMDLGIIMSIFNQVYHMDTLSIVCEFVPQMIFLNGLFGYLCFLIIYKWISGSIADLYNVLINMFLAPTNLEDSDKMFSGQVTIQIILVLAAIGSIPWMLFPKPLILNARHKQKMKDKVLYHHVSHIDSDAQEEEEEGNNELQEQSFGHDEGHGGGHGDKFEFGEVMVHQMIHTIEFVLGAVSNTASYLRLWALTLAHAQLSAVFYDKVLMLVASMSAESRSTINIIFIIIGFYVFTMATFGVLMIMESLSAFLHALRLHWVEYMNKFYHGDGYPFYPFTFADLTEEDL